jgi:hypothetical protein
MIVIMFLIGGIEAIGGMVPAGFTTPVLAVLGGLAAYFKVNPSQTY